MKLAAPSKKPMSVLHHRSFPVPSALLCEQLQSSPDLLWGTLEAMAFACRKPDTRLNTTGQAENPYNKEQQEL